MSKKSKPSASSSNIADKGKVSEYNAVAEAQNWEQSVRGEIEAPKKWNEAWGSYFSNGVPLDNEERIKYFEAQLKTIPADVSNRAIYEASFKKLLEQNVAPNYRRKTMSQDERI